MDESDSRSPRGSSAPSETSPAAAPGTAPLYVSTSRVELAGPLHRRARLALGATAEFGVHGAVCQHYKLTPPRELPLPVDYIVAATAG